MLMSWPDFWWKKYTIQVSEFHSVTISWEKPFCVISLKNAIPWHLLEKCHSESFSWKIPFCDIFPQKCHSVAFSWKLHYVQFSPKVLFNDSWKKSHPVDFIENVILWHFLQEGHSVAFSRPCHSVSLSWKMQFCDIPVKMQFSSIFFKKAIP